MLWRNYTIVLISLITNDVEVQRRRNNYSTSILTELVRIDDNIIYSVYEGCSKWIAYFYLETLNFKLAQKYSFHALEVLPVARNAKFQPMYPLLEDVTVRWFGHSNKVLMNGRKVLVPVGTGISVQQGMLSISETKRNHMGQGLGNTGGEAKQLLFLSSKMP